MRTAGAARKVPFGCQGKERAAIMRVLSSRHTFQPTWKRV